MAEITAEAGLTPWPLLNQPL